MNLIKYFLAVFLFCFSLSVVSPALAAATETLGDLDKTAGQVTAYKSQTGTSDPRAAVVTKVGNIVGLILSFIGIIFLVLTIYAGLMWMTAQGNSGQVEKAKDLLINAVIGLVIITAAYSITAFVGDQLVK